MQLSQENIQRSASIAQLGEHSTEDIQSSQSKGPPFDPGWKHIFFGSKKHSFLFLFDVLFSRAHRTRSVNHIITTVFRHLLLEALLLAGPTLNRCRYRFVHLCQ